MRAQSDIKSAVADLATKQHGVISRGQMLAMGLSRQTIGRWIAEGRLHRVHHGVYAVGHRVLGPHGRWMAAVLAGGREAVLSHRSAAEAWEIWPRYANDRRPIAQPPIDVTVAARGGRTRPGLHIHRNRLQPDDVTTLAGIPITGPSRTLVDLAAIARTDRFVERCLDEARYRRVLELDDLRASMTRARDGTARLHRVLAAHRPGTTRTRSGLEERFFSLLRDAGLPLPLCQQRIGRMTVDFLWPAHRLVAETDGGPFHDTPSRRRRDALRDAALHRRGLRIIRIPEAEIETRSPRVAELVASALDARPRARVVF